MTGIRVYVLGIGIVSPLGKSLAETTEALRLGRKGLGPLTVFPTAGGNGCLAGEVSEPVEAASVPRTHRLARMAAAQAMAECREPPDAVVLGTTTGGMLTTESLLRENARDPGLYRYHSLGSVAEDIALRYRCTGPVITVSTACSSGAVAVKVALEMLRSGMGRRILAGGADSLCRLTYYGFSALQLIDPQGARPLDRQRRGMTLAEGAGMLLLVANEPDNAIAELLGAGLSCDAYHPTAPDPWGMGALEAMKAAVEDAGISVADIGYVNLHGTGTPDNDLSEARAVNALFADRKPLISSIKGASGHTLGAAGAIEAVVSAVAVSEGLVPANTGCESPDPELGLDPVRLPLRMAPSAVLSNSLGFGGNNACLVVGPPGKYGRASAGSARRRRPLAVLGSACITGAGDTKGTLDGLSQGRPCQGTLSLGEISKDLSPADVRRLKRLPRLVLSLAVAAYQDSGKKDTPTSVFAGTGWGALSETHCFLKGLYETGERFPSPTDFVGSVHNAPACQVAMRFKALGANVTTTGGDYSFEQSLMVAELVAGETDGTILVVGADEAHPELSELFDRSVLPEATLSDGGGALCLARGRGGSGPSVCLVFFENGEDNSRVISSLIRSLGGPESVTARCGAVFAGIPGGCRKTGEEQLALFLALTRFKGPVIDYRRFTGEFAAASSVATVAASRFVAQGWIPGSLFGGEDLPLHRKGGLVLGFGGFVTAVEVAPE